MELGECSTMAELGSYAYIILERTYNKLTNIMVYDRVFKGVATTEEDVIKDIQKIIDIETPDKAFIIDKQLNPSELFGFEFPLEFEKEFYHAYYIYKEDLYLNIGYNVVEKNDTIYIKIQDFIRSLDIYKEGYNPHEL
jgi:hypothetical protein